jgi:energy-converting hydrogenase Eha subunit H
MPALPLGDAGPYVAAAYLVFLALVLIYVAIMAAKLARIQREIGELAALAERRSAERAEGRREDATASAPAGAEAGAPR